MKASDAIIFNRELNSFFINSAKPNNIKMTLHKYMVLSLIHKNISPLSKEIKKNETSRSAEIKDVSLPDKGAE
jgi:16S rRNA C1402 N4-methylase RsmH